MTHVPVRHLVQTYIFSQPNVPMKHLVQTDIFEDGDYTFNLCRLFPALPVDYKFGCPLVVVFLFRESLLFPVEPLSNRGGPFSAASTPCFNDQNFSVLLSRTPKEFRQVGLWHDAF